MLKTISAALLAVSVIAAPALAASTDKTATAPVNKTTAPAAKTTAAPVIKSERTKSKTLNANARMGHHTNQVRHHRSHKHMGVVKTHATPKLAVKPIAPAKRG
jgi:hypothetical protein